MSQHQPNSPRPAWCSCSLVLLRELTHATKYCQMDLQAGGACDQLAESQRTHKASQQPANPTPEISEPHPTTSNGSARRFINVASQASCWGPPVSVTKA